jgi:hypothetical protein
MRRLLVAFTVTAVAAAYLIFSPYFEKLNNPNENVRVYMAMSLAESQTFAINSLVSRWGYVNDKAKKGDLLFPGKAPGTSYLAAPAVWLGLKVSALRGVEATKHAVVSWSRLGATTLPLLLFFAFYFRATRWVTDHLPTRLLGLLMLALGSTLLSYGGLAVSHSVAAAASFGGYLAVLAHRREPERPYLPLLAGLCFGTAVMMEYPGLLGAGVAWLLGFWGSPKRVRYTLLTVAGSLLPIGLLALYHLRAFGSIGSTPYANLENPTFAAYVSGGFFGLKALQSNAFMGSFFAPATGLFWFAPWTILAVVTLSLAVTSSRLREPALLAIGTLVVYGIFISMVQDWRGGWGAGPRYIVPAVPVLAWYLLQVLAELRETRVGDLLWAATASLVLVAMFVCGISAAFFPHYPLDSLNPVFELGTYLVSRGIWPHTTLGWFGVPGAWAVGLVSLLAFGCWGAVVAEAARERGWQGWTAALASLACAVGLLTAMSRVETPDRSQVDKARALVFSVWEPREAHGLAAPTGEPRDGCALPATCTPAEDAAAMRRLGASGYERAAMGRWNAGPRGGVAAEPPATKSEP